MQSFGCLGFILPVSVSFNFQISVSVFEMYLSIQTPCMAYGQYILDMEEIGEKKV